MKKQRNHFKNKHEKPWKREESSLTNLTNFCLQRHEIFDERVDELASFDVLFGLFELVESYRVLHD